jgi:L-alanine-DL-glutamate epimerase-like enolase superfamily enzyme
MIKKKVREASEYSILKIKLGSDRDRDSPAIREVTDRELRVDANCGWTVKHTIRMLPVLEEFGVTVLEQPLVPEDIDGLGEIRRHCRIPLIVDESCITSTDIPRLVGKVDGINIKLAKTGSLREAIRMIHIARAHHLLVMVGCMVETSIAITTRRRSSRRSWASWTSTARPCSPRIRTPGRRSTAGGWCCHPGQSLGVAARALTIDY